MMSLTDGHVTTIAVDPDWQRQGVATRLLIALAREAIARGATALTLEVRLSHRGAQQLYQHFGFTSVGRAQGLLRAIRARTRSSCGRTRSISRSTRRCSNDSNATCPARPCSNDQELVTVRILGIETSCDETAAAVVEDGRRVRSSVVSSQVDLHARYGGVVPEIASRAHVEIVNDVIASGAARSGRDVARRRRGRRGARAGAGGRAARRCERGEGDRPRDRPSVRRRQPSRGAHVRGAARGSGARSRRS